MATATGSIEKIFFKDAPSKYGKYRLSIKLSDGFWYTLGSSDRNTWNKKVGDSFHEMKEGDWVSFPWETFGESGRSAKRSQVTLIDAPSGQEAPPTPKPSSGGSYSQNNPAEVGQLVNAAINQALALNPKTKDLLGDARNLVPTMVDSYLEFKKEADTLLTAAKQEPAPKPEPAAEAKPDDYDDDIPF